MYACVHVCIKYYIGGMRLTFAQLIKSNIIAHLTIAHRKDGWMGADSKKGESNYVMLEKHCI